MALASTLFTACGGTDKGDGSGHMYNAVLMGNPKSLDPQYASDVSSATVIKNMYSGLFSTDSSGKIYKCNVSDYDVSDDGKVYTFKLREDNYWFFDKNENDVIDDDEYFPVTADDYVFAFQRILDPKMQSPYAENFSFIKGADKVLSGEASPETAEIYASDKHTLVIVLENKNADFLRLLSSQAAMPCNRQFFNSTKGRYGLDDHSVMSNGAFFVRQWFYDSYGQNNILYMRKNDINSCEDYEIIPSLLSFFIEEEEKTARELFKDETIECFTTYDISSYNPKKYNIEGSFGTTLGIVFNPDNEVTANLNFRKAIAVSADRSLLREDDDVLQADGIIPPDMPVMDKKFRDMSDDSVYRNYEPYKAYDLIQQGLEELGKEETGDIRILVNADTIGSDSIEPLIANWNEMLGLKIGIEDVSTSEFNSRIADGDYTLALYALRGGYAGGASFIEKFENEYCLKNKLSDKRISGELMKCTDANEMVDKLAEAEKMLLDEYVFVPVYYKKSYLVSHIENENIKYDAFSGAVDFRTALNYR